MRDDLNLSEVAESLYCLRIPDGDAHLLNSYLWLGNSGVTIFDTGWESSASIIEAALLELGRRPSDVERVILSHFHDDHAGAAAEISGWSDSEIVCSVVEAPVIRGSADGPLPRFTAAERAIHAEPTRPPRAQPCRVDTEVVDGDTLAFAGGAHVLHVPGHTPGSIALHIPDLDLVLTGDSVAEFNGQVVLGVFNVDRHETALSAHKIASTGASAAGFGHGEPVLSNAGARIKGLVDPFAENDSH